MNFSAIESESASVCSFICLFVCLFVLLQGSKAQYCEEEAEERNSRNVTELPHHHS